ncbi:RNA-directed DNA polymerase from mobile element jockey-like [Elysia marginata]|uniref:RNA-directed DNA polymerase from mobile element jockey-like n=1 Tax=Elysia marginata TaxID=1093978 RepID=A0AAV4EBW7_9GAST|nr:RNA-directed DNA polymerase from mobile element jockey-like [Elysia marginata]
MKNGKAAGPDQIPIELLKALGNWGIDQLTKLLNRIYDTGNIPKDMLISTFITLQKKPGATECENHRTISLMSHTLKLLLKILLTRIRSKIKPEISETQLSEMILRDLDNFQGIGLGGYNINNIRYADDTVLMAQSEQSLQKMLDIVVKESEIKGLSLDIAKTESMTISKKPQAPSCKIRSNGTQVKQVNQFKYLGYMLTSDGKCETHIRKRIIT